MNDRIIRRASRRSFLRKTLAGCASVVGFDAHASSWIAADNGAASHAHFSALPPLDGTLHLDETTRRAHAQDFGNIVQQYPLAVLKPGSTNDVRRMLEFASRHGIRVVGRGRGHTVFGQSQVRAGIVIDVTSLQAIHEIGSDRVDVDAGIRWNTLLEATLQRGLMPPALTDFIGQTVGGTLSVGGIGGLVYRAGAQVDNVLELQVVTGDGRQLTCSPTRHRQLFDAVLAGQGQVGIIVRATLRLVPAPTQIRVFNLVYPNLFALTSDMQRLMDDARFEFMEAFAFLQGDGTWAYLLQAGSMFTPPSVPDDPRLLDGLADIRAFVSVEDATFAAFANRVQIDFSQAVHPWIDLILPYPAIDTFVGEVEQVLRPLVQGDRFSILLIPMRTDRFTRPLFRAPKARHAFGFGILRFMPNDKASVDKVLGFNKTLFDRCLDLGGTHYPISAVRLERHDWIRHYGAQFPRLLAAKAHYDPANVLTGGPDMF